MVSTETVADCFIILQNYVTVTQPTVAAPFLHFCEISARSRVPEGATVRAEIKEVTTCSRVTRQVPRGALDMSAGRVHNHPFRSSAVSTVRISAEGRLRVTSSPRCLISYAT